MSTMMDARPALDDVLDDLRGLLPDIAARARQTAADGHVPRVTFDELTDIGVFRLMQPARFGGYEYGPTALARVGFELGSACGSTGWCGALAVCFGWMTSFFPLEAQQEVWDDPTNLLAVSYVPSPHVTPVAGGYRMTGQWPWASGVDNATWMILAALIPDADKPTPAWCLVPVSDITIDHGSWNSAGLEGTGSKSVYTDEPIFVPAHRVLPLPLVMSGKVPGREVPENPQAAYGYPTFGPTALVAPIVGMAQGALDAFTATATDGRRQTRPGVVVKLAETESIQRLIGSVSAQVDAARTLMLTSLQEGEALAAAGELLSIEQRTRIRRDSAYAARSCAEATTALFAKSGARGADQSGAVQRFWRDASTAALHATIDWDMVAEMYGTQALGLTPLGIF